MSLSRRHAGPLAVGVVGLAVLFGLPHAVDLYLLLQLSLYVIMAILALSLGLVWGYAGILCFGQAAFFGLGAYTYAISAFNMTESTWPFLLSIAVPGLFAAALGYVMFYGRLSDVYVGVTTLVVTLIFYRFIGHTAGSEYRIGKALLGGFNGIPAVPPLVVPGWQLFIGPEELFYVAMALLLAVYLGMRWLLASHFGRTVVAIRENEMRAELLGYDVRLHKLLVFAVGGAVAGLAGCLFANWNAFVDPNVFSLGTTAQILIWVLVGGLGTLVGPMLGAIVLLWLTTQLGAADAMKNILGSGHNLDTNLVLGAILVLFVLLVPRGAVPSIAWLARALYRGRSVSPGS